MYAPYTGRICPPPVYSDLDDPLINQLYLFSVPFAESISTSYYFLLESSSFFFLIELLSFLCFDSKPFLPLCCLYYLFTNSIKEEFIDSLKYTSVSFCSTIKSITDEDLFSSFVKDYLKYPDFSFSLFLTNPLYLIDWVISVDVSLRPLLTPLKETKVVDFYVELVKKYSNTDVRDITFQYRALKENVQRTHYNYVLGADISDAKI